MNIAQNTNQIAYLVMKLEDIGRSIWENVMLAEIERAMQLMQEFTMTAAQLLDLLSVMQETKSFNKEQVLIFMQIISFMERAMLDMDYIFLADLIKYEITPMLDSWYRVLNMEPVI
ncbi:MAG: hypothetical protein ACUVTU_08730 [Desulfurispora sp.]|uniref:hypothetical protein n=1 Tax=Desulfurispora sp. TaxID=3014275 RepID=UPI004049B9FA